MFSKFFKPNIKKMLQKDDIEGLKSILKGENSNDRLKFFEIINNLEDEKAVNILTDTMADMWPSDRKKAIKFFGEKKNPSAIESLIKYLEYHETIYALVNMGTPSVEPLICLLDKDCKYQSDERKKIHAIDALGKIKDDIATSRLIKIVKEPVSILTQSAIKALGLIGNSECIEYLIKLLKDQDEYKRNEAYNAIRWVEKDKITEPLLNALYLNEDDPHFKDHINSLLIEVGDDSAVQNIIGLLESDNDKVHTAAIEALKRIKWTPQSKKQELWMSVIKYKWDDVKKFNELAFIPAIRLLKNEDKYLRKGAAEILGNIMDKKSVHFLINALKDEEIGRIARDSLVKLKEFSIEPLISSMADNSKNFTEQLRIIEALDKIGDAKAIKPLFEFIKHSEDTLLKRNAEKALKKICISIYWLNEKYALELHRRSSDNEGEMNIPDIFIQALSDKNEDIRILAAEILGSLNNNLFIDLIIEAWREKRIPSIVLIELITIPSNPKYLDILKEILISGPQFNRIHAVKALNTLSWNPNDLNEQLYLWMGEEEWNKIAELGEVAYKPLKTAFQEYSRELHRSQGSRKSKICIDTQMEIIKTIGDTRNVYFDEFIHNEYISSVNHYILVRRALVETLAKLSTPKALYTMTLALNDSDYQIRLSAIQKLEEVGYEPAENSFVEKLHDKNSEIRTLASKALDKLNWEPTPPDSLHYYIEKHNTEEILKFGKNAVDVLIGYLKEFSLTNKNKLYIMNILCDLEDLRAAYTILKQISDHPGFFDSWSYIPSNEKLKKIFGDYTDLIINTLSYAKYDDPDLGQRKQGTISDLNGDKNIKEFDFTENTKSVEELCKIKTPVADRLLNIMKTRAYDRYSENWMYHESRYGYVKDGIFTGVNLGIQRSLSEEELERRGYPPYNESAFLIKENWYF